MSEVHGKQLGYVLGPTEGEHLIRNAGSIFIKVDPSRGSTNMALGTQQVPIGTGIRVQHARRAAKAIYSRTIERHCAETRDTFQVATNLETLSSLVFVSPPIVQHIEGAL